VRLFELDEGFFAITIVLVATIVAVGAVAFTILDWLGS
jgi:hypothetical protein